MLAVVGAVSLSLLAAGAFSPKPVAEQMEFHAQQLSVEEIGHYSWDTLLRRYVNELGLVDYSAWKSNPRDVAALDDYLALLSQADLERDASRKARIAFWINAYNALTVRGILKDYPNAKTADADSRSHGDNKPRGDSRLAIGDSSYSLDEIEHEVLHVLNEPQAHFAFVCGARGCPRLSNRAFTSTTLQSQFKENTRAFLADPSKLTVDDNAVVQVSPLLKWYADDTGKSPAEVLQSLAPSLPADLKAKLKNQGKLRIGYLDYDWTLNDQATGPTAPPLPPDTEAVPSDRSLGPK
jgi:hypothetical protein